MGSDIRRSASPQGAHAFVAPDLVRFPVQKGRMFVEMLPRGLADVVRESLQDVAQAGRPEQDAFGHESLHDADVEAERVASRLSPYVEPENFLFLFGQSLQALQAALLHVPVECCGKDIPARPRQKGQDRQCRANEENKADNVAVVVCKIQKAKPGEHPFRSEQQGPANDSPCRAVTWREFQQLKSEFEYIGHARNFAEPRALRQMPICGEKPRLSTPTNKERK